MDGVTDNRAGEACTAVVEHPHDIAIGDAARLSIAGVNQNRFAPLHFARLRIAAVVVLAVQPRARLVGHKMERKVFGLR